MQRGVGTVEKVQRSCPLGHTQQRPSHHFPRPTRRMTHLRDSYCEIWILRRFNLRFLDFADKKLSCRFQGLQFFVGKDER